MLKIVEKIQNFDTRKIFIFRNNIPYYTYLHYYSFLFIRYSIIQPMKS